VVHIEMMPVERLVPYARNARTHSDQQVAQIAASIVRFGFTNPILISDDDVIIAGHGRLMAAKQLALAEVPTIRLAHLNEAERRALVVAAIRPAARLRRSEGEGQRLGQADARRIFCCHRDRGCAAAGEA
jgi:ParB-like chromosome segregation protein Spo0J